TISTCVYTLSLHDALPIFLYKVCGQITAQTRTKILIRKCIFNHDLPPCETCHAALFIKQKYMLPSTKSASRQHPLKINALSVKKDRKSTRLNSSHVKISYA